MFRKTKFISSILATVVVSTLFLSTSCKQFNDNPSENEKMRIDISGLKQQFGYGSTADGRLGMTVPADTDATDHVKSAVIGAMVVTKSTTPYTMDTTITEKIQNDITDDIMNSAEFLQIVDLTSAPSYIEFEVPKEKAGNWQILAVALRTRPADLAALSEDEHENASVYYGFSDHFITTDEIGTTVSLTVTRGCLVDAPPKGCATYDDTITSTPTVTKGVEILSVEYNISKIHGVWSGTPITDSSVNFPLVIRTDDQTADAITKLKTLRDAIPTTDSTISTVSDIKSLMIKTAHAANPNESAGCQALKSSSPTVAELTAACEVQEYKLIYKE